MIPPPSLKAAAEQKILKLVQILLMAALSVVTLSRNEQKMKSKLKSAKDGLDSKIKVKTQKITNI